MDILKILLVEDNPDHALIIRKGLQTNHVVNEIMTVEDGQEALDYLLRRGRFADESQAPRPGLILLDIKLPKVDGFTVLERIKGDASLKSIPVVMLTSSEQEVDIVKSYQNGANSYVTKPIQFEDFLKTIRDLRLYWVLVNKLPHTEEG